MRCKFGAFLFLAAVEMFAQGQAGQAILIGAPPGGAGSNCNSQQGYLSNGVIYTCAGSPKKWTAAGGSGGGVTSVFGQTGDVAPNITVDGSSNIGTPGGLDTGVGGTDTGSISLTGKTSGSAVKLQPSDTTGAGVIAPPGANGTAAYSANAGTEGHCVEYDSDGFGLIDAGAGCGGGDGSVSVTNTILNVSGAPYGPTAALTAPGSSGWTNTGYVTPVIGGDTYLACTAVGSDKLQTYMKAHTGTFTVVAGFKIAMNMATSGTVTSAHGITISDGTNNIQFLFGAQTGAAANDGELAIFKWTGTTTVGSTYNIMRDTSMFSYLGGLLWQKVVLDATNITWSWSIDNGLNWIQFDQQPKGDFLGTITSVGVGSFCNTAGAIALYSWSGV